MSVQVHEPSVRVSINLSVWCVGNVTSTEITGEWNRKGCVQWSRLTSACKKTHTRTQTMDFPEHLKLLQQLESLWGDGSEREEGRREGGRGRKKGGKWRQTAIHAFKASTPEINTTFCILAVGRVHISQCVSECFTGEGG